MHKREYGFQETTYMHAYTRIERDKKQRNDISYKRSYTNNPSAHFPSFKNRSSKLVGSEMKQPIYSVIISAPEHFWIQTDTSYILKSSQSGQYKSKCASFSTFPTSHNSRPPGCI